MEKPKQLETVDLTALRQACQEYIDFMDNDEEYCEDCIEDFEHPVMEKAMEAIFGWDIWDFINTRQD
jgi:hypothetical protein